MRNALPRRPTIVAFTLVEIMIVILIIGMLLAIAVPNFLDSRDTSRSKTCIANLRQIETAKQQYMVVNNTTTFTSSTDLGAAGLYPTYIMSEPQCPAGGTYSTGDDNNVANCSLATQQPAYFGSSGTYPHVLNW
jgi:prepilin-type N-terminal cleavage/methylation domain-containing protein